MSRYAYSIFSDDLRYERGNKLSYMGVYASDLIVDNFPIQLPKFVITSSIATPIDRLINKLSLSILLNEAVLRKFDFPDDELASAQQSVLENAIEGEPSKEILLTSQMFFFALEIDKPSIITAIFNADGEDIRSGRLRVHNVRPKIE